MLVYVNKCVVVGLYYIYCDIFLTYCTNCGLNEQKIPILFIFFSHLM